MSSTRCRRSRFGLRSAAAPYAISLPARQLIAAAQAYYHRRDGPSTSRSPERPRPGRVIEELTLNAWPPLQSMLYDGWLLGFSHGYTRRANSVQSLYPSSLPLDEKIAICE